MKDWQRTQTRRRRAPLKRVAVTTSFTNDDLAAIAYQVGADEPSLAQLRRFIGVAIYRDLAKARERYASRPLEDADAREKAEC